MSKIVYGKEVYTTLEELVAPGRTAVLVVDMQNDFCHPEGSGAARGRSHQGAWRIVPRLASLLESARACAVPVVYCLNTQRPNALYLSPAELGRRMKKSGGDPLLWTIEGSWGHRVVDPIAPKPDDFIVLKHRPSAFHQTDLEFILRNLGIESVIVTGVGTRGCVESTARDAQSRDFYILIPEDTTASQRPEWYEAAILLMRTLYHWVGPSAEIEAAWAAARADAGAASAAARA
ncbi:MAG: cysteine hydrolase [Proteobacteria bacterium]|nr:cysteine hydrolase [Pseudomonadota bacterium]